MNGTIRTKQTCPICKGKFTHIDKLGLICRSHMTTPSRYYVDLPFKGERIRIYSHKSGRVLDSYEIALETIEHVRYEIRNHAFDPSKYVKTALKYYLFENVMKKWLAVKEAAKIVTIYKYKQFDRDFFLFFSTMDVREIRTSHVQEFYMQLPARLSNKTKKHIMAALHNFFGWIRQMEYIDKLPIFPVVPEDQPDWKWVDVDIQSTILLAIPERDRFLFLFLALHGCRPSEARALKVKDLDFSQKSIAIRRTFSGRSSNILMEHTKTKKMRLIPSNPEMFSILKEICKDKLPEAFVFVNPRTGKPYAKSTFQELWHDACEKAGVKIKPYEGLRHSFASQRVSRGVDIYLISKVLGHSDIRTTQRYAHTNLDALKDIMSVPGSSPRQNKDVTNL